MTRQDQCQQNPSEKDESTTMSSLSRKMFKSQTNLSSSEHKACMTYVCLVGNLTPNGSHCAKAGPGRHSFHIVEREAAGIDSDEPIQVERSKAQHNIEVKDSDGVNTSLATTAACDDSGSDDNEEPNFIEFDNPNVLKLTRMKWLTDGTDGAADASSPSLSPAGSTTSSNMSQDSTKFIDSTLSSTEKHLSTILKLDREHNMFGLSNIAIVGSQPLRKPRKEDKPVFPQTAIVQICCGKGCCRHMSNTDMPMSLKCGGCRSCISCVDPTCDSCKACGSPCGTTCESPCSTPCKTTASSLSPSCPKRICSKCRPPLCSTECTPGYGLTITLTKKTKYEPYPVELTPRSSCVLQKPLAARSCHHYPHCLPPSSCFPYLMPCFWPSRPSAPCTNPARCFHNPPCQPARKPKGPRDPNFTCPTGGVKCTDEKRLGKTKEICGNETCAKAKEGANKCANDMCPGKIPEMKEAIEKLGTAKQAFFFRRY